MRFALSLVLLALSTGACVMDDPESTTVSDIKVNPATDGTEPGYVNGRNCTMVFPGALTPSTQTYAIWNIGTHGIVNAPYNTASRPNVYAVFGTGATAGEVHHVATPDGSLDAYDHYHVLDVPHGHKVKNQDWDLLVLVPGPNFNAATYHSATSVPMLLAQSAAGILSPVLTPTQAFGLPGLVLHAPVNCSHGDQHGHNGHDDDDDGDFED